MILIKKFGIEKQST